MLVHPSVIERAGAGEEEAFNQIVRAYQGRILGITYRLLGYQRDAEDISQEVFVRLWKSLDQLFSAEMFERWLYRLTVNAVYDYVRKRRRHRDISMSDLREEQLHVVDGALSSQLFVAQRNRNEIRELVSRMLGQLSAADRVLLTLKEVEGLSLKELQAIYEVDTNALKVRLFRARKRALRALERMQERQVTPVEAHRPGTRPVQPALATG